MNFSKLTKYLDILCGTFQVPGCDCVIYQNHRPIYRHMVGHSDLQRQQPVSERDIYWLYSNSKIATCVAALQLVEQGKIALSDPVSAYLPEYASLTVREGDIVRPAKQVMTIEHLFTMTSGLDYQMDTPPIRQVLEQYGDQATTRQIVAAFARSPLGFEPGSSFFYSFSHDVLAAVVEVVSGQRFRDYVDEHICRPLGMCDTGFQLPPERESRMAEKYRVTPQLTLEHEGKKNTFTFGSAYDSGGAGVHSTVNDFILLLDALANDGTGATGAQILRPETVADMGTCRVARPTLEREFGFAADHLGCGYGLGVRTRVDNTFTRAPLGEFGWNGAAGAWSLIDPVNHLSVFYAQHVMEHVAATLAHQPRLRELVYEGLEG